MTTPLDYAANSFKYLSDIRWSLLCLINKVSVKAQLFHNLCLQYEAQICEEILVGGYNENNTTTTTTTTLEEISRIYYIILEEALCLDSLATINQKSPKEMSPNFKEIYHQSKLIWKGNNYLTCSRNKLLKFFSDLSLDKVLLNFLIFFC
jgi:hypothetical protein